MIKTNYYDDYGFFTNFAVGCCPTHAIQDEMRRLSTQPTAYAAPSPLPTERVATVCGGPYGMLIAKANTLPTDAQPYKYGGKELDRRFGLDSYDFEARIYDPATGRFTQPDPLAWDTPEVSPYVYCAANPIRYIDPTGENPVYTPDGEYLGDTSEGFCGEILIYSGSEIDDIQRLSYDEIITNYGAMTMDEYQSIDELQLSGSALSNIWTNIVSHFEGEMFFGRRFSLNSLKNYCIGYSCPNTTDIKKVPNFSTEFYVKKLEKSTIYGTGTNHVDYENTVENLVCSILYHEWLCHGTLKMSGNKDHITIYNKYVKRNRFWDKTTERYKKAVENKIEYYRKRL